MASQTPQTGPGLVSNPFVKKRNLQWSISPPPPKRKRPESQGDPPPSACEAHLHALSSAAIEAGRARVQDPAAHFASVLSASARGDGLSSSGTSAPACISATAVKALYDACAASDGGGDDARRRRQDGHFVVHQHDHPIAGPHYDLRLQINPTSSASWAVMYGLPGDPGSVHPGRTAAETRVHCLWNHLIETASSATGSLLIWDTGTYEVLPPLASKGRRRGDAFPETESEEESENEDEGEGEDGEPKGMNPGLSQQEKLQAAFASRKIRLRLNGARLPRGYTINLRLTKAADIEGRARASRSTGTPRRRWRTGGQDGKQGRAAGLVETSSEDSDGDSSAEGVKEDLIQTTTDAVDEPGEEKYEEAKSLSQMEREIRELEDETVRRTNAYTGASNTIGSVHQRRWFLSLDKAGSGFVGKRVDGKVKWERPDFRGDDEAVAGNSQPFPSTATKKTRLDFPFYVRGPEYERSVVTGRLGKDVLQDEGVTGFVPRKGWRPILN